MKARDSGEVAERGKGVPVERQVETIMDSSAAPDLKFDLWHLSWTDWRAVLKRVFAFLSTERVTLTAAGVSYYTLLALFPALAALVSVYGLITDANSLSAHLDTLAGIVPDSILRKPARLTPEERKIMEEHAMIGALCLAVGVGQVRPRRGFQSLEVDAWLNEDEAAIVAFALLETKKFLTPGLEFFGRCLEQMEIGAELEPEDDEDMEEH